jgi:hypothetical protein
MTLFFRDSALEESPMDGALKAKVRAQLSDYVLDDELLRLKEWMDIARKDTEKSYEQACP